MDLSRIDFNFIEIFDQSYAIARDVFEVEPIEASPKVLKKIRKWVEKNYIAGETYPKSVMTHIDKGVDDAAFIGFLKACYDHVQANGTYRKQLFDKFSAELDEDTKDLLWLMLSQDLYDCRIRQIGADAQIDLKYGGVYRRTLTLVNASCLPQEPYDCLCFEKGSLIKRDGEYRLVGEAENFADDTATPFVIRFADARSTTEVYRADIPLFIGKPWEQLESLAYALLEKYELSGDHFNDREKELLPLISEIGKLFVWMCVPDDYATAGFPQLTAYCRRYGYHELLPLLEQFEKADGKRKDRLSRKLTSKLNRQRYEPLWREICRCLADSQAEYPCEIDLHCSAEKVDETRQEIQKRLEEHGYTGHYPDFVKTGALRGIRLVDSYDQTYFVGLEKRVVYHIHCEEACVDDQLRVNFICGTELLRAEEAPGDIYSCMFDAKGRRLFQMAFYTCYRDTVAEDLEKRVEIAVKKAELIKLTKEEKKAIGEPPSFLAIFLAVFVILGGFFGVAMTACMMLFAVITALIAGQPESISAVFTDIPWWQLFLLAWVLFGGAMGVLTGLAKRK